MFFTGNVIKGFGKSGITLIAITHKRDIVSGRMSNFDLSSGRKCEPTNAKIRKMHPINMVNSECILQLNQIIGLITYYKKKIQRKLSRKR